MVSPRPAQVVIDCRAVVDTWHLPVQDQLATGQTYTGIMRSSLRDVNRPTVRAVQWMRSHRPPCPGRSLRTSVDRRGGRPRKGLEYHDDDAFPLGTMCNLAEEVEHCPHTWRHWPGGPDSA